jgi:DHA1 family solute carrier family 18 vesicular amine transporter 1/2
MLLYGMVVPILPSLLGPAATEADAGLVLSVYAVAVLVALPFVGKWVDRVGNRSPLLLGSVALALSCLLFARGGSIELLIAARALQGLAAAVSWTAGLTLVASTHPPEERGVAFGQVLAVMGIGTLAGPAVGGWLFAVGGPGAPFIFAAVLSLLDGLARLLLIRDEAPASLADGPGPSRDLRAGLRIFTLTFIGALALSWFEPILPLRLSRIAGADPQSLGLLFGGAMLASSLLFPIVGRYTVTAAQRRAATTFGLLLSAAAAFSLGWTTTVLGTGLALAALGVASTPLFSVALTELSALAAARSPPAYGSAFAYQNFAYSVGLAVGPLLGGRIAVDIGAAGAAAVLSGPLLIGPLLLWALDRVQLPGAPDAPEGP